MSIRGQRHRRKSNIIERYPSLPIPIRLGSLSWRNDLGQPPSVTLEYEGLLEPLLLSIKSIYPLGFIFTIYSIPFEVKKVGSDRTSYPITDTYKLNIELQWAYTRALSKSVKAIYLPIRTVSVTERGVARRVNQLSVGAIARQVGVPYSGNDFWVEVPQDADLNYSVTLAEVLESNAKRFGCFISYENGIVLKTLRQGNRHTFVKQDCINTSSLAVQFPVGYRSSELTGYFTNPLPRQVQVTGLRPFVATAPVTRTLIEGDRDPEEPPLSSKELVGLDSNADMSGPKKTKKITRTLNDSTVAEEVLIYGFNYLLEDMPGSINGVPRINDPQEVRSKWVVIERRLTEYIYTQLQPITFNIRVRDPSGSGSVAAIIHPDYRQYITISGSTGQLRLPVKYLSEIRISGRRKARFVKENDNVNNEATDNSIEDDGSGAPVPAINNPWYRYFHFFDQPIKGKTVYYLRPSRLDYQDDVPAIFLIDFQKYRDLSPRLQAEVRNRNITHNGLVAVLVPNYTFVEPYLVWAETSQVNAFSFTPDPIVDALPRRGDLVTGEETFNQTKREKTSSNSYREFSTEYSSQDVRYTSSLEQIRFRDVVGRPPEATIMRVDWQDQTPQPNNPTAVQRRRHYLTTPTILNAVSVGESLNYPTARTLQEGVLAAETDLTLKGMELNQQGKTLSYYYPQLKPGDFVAVQGDPITPNGTWHITNISWTLQFKGKALDFDPLCTCDGTQITLGFAQKTRIDVRTVTEDAGGGDVQITTSLTQDIGDRLIGRVLGNTVANRRNFLGV